MNFIQGDRVRIEKVGSVDQPNQATASKEEYEPGKNNPNVSPFVGYWITGTLLVPLEAGRAVLVNRDSRNGVSVGGLFQSSMIEEVYKKDGYVLFDTMNSTYKIEKLS